MSLGQDCPAEADVASCIFLLLNSLSVISSGFDLNFGVALSHFPFAIRAVHARLAHDLKCESCDRFCPS